MGIDEQENHFQEDDYVPLEELENHNALGSAERLDNGDNGEPKATRRSDQDIRVCDVCGKTFVGGKAYGGHRRSHFQTKKVGLTIKIKKDFLGLSDSDKSSGRRSSGSKKMRYYRVDRKRTCCVCKRNFPSVRALLGHMRAYSHSHREAVQPPPPPRRKGSSSSMSDSADDHSGSPESCMKSDTDLLNSVSNWSKTEKRRRTSIGGVEAARILVSMSRGENCCSTIHDANEGQKWGYSDSCMDQRFDPSEFERQVESNIEFHRGSSLRLVVEHLDRTNFEGSVPGELSKESLDISKKEKKKKGKGRIGNLRDSEAEESGLTDGTQKMSYSFQCSNCGKSFPTFQALGGHRSIHTKNTNRKATNASFADATVGGKQIREDHSVQIEKRKESKKTFPVIQAPDDHTRGHWNRLDEAPSREEVAPGEAKEATEAGPRTVDFDLNETFVVDDVEGESKSV